jgi:uncharacterized protein YkwD
VVASRRRIRWAALPLLAAGALTLPGLVPGAGAKGKPGRDGCADARLTPTGATAERVVTATVCLLNVERGTRGLPALRGRVELGTAAGRYAAEMVRRQFFDHVSPTGSTMTSRVRATRYLRGADGWSLGENIAWAVGADATAEGTVRAWMSSPPHRANILDAAFRDVGIGVSQGAPLPVATADPTATFVGVFGGRGNRR